MPRYHASVATLAILAESASGRIGIGTKSLCDRLNPRGGDLPKECVCSETERLHATVRCAKPFNGTVFEDTIGIELDLDVCNEVGSSASLRVTERNHDVDFPIETVRAGEEKNVPIPGLSFVVPLLGSAGVDATVLVAGNPDELTLRVGLNACVHVRGRELCGSRVPGLRSELPWYVLNGHYAFGDICEGAREGTNVG